jgi:tetratricopeptide (TPR) repeat protein
MDKSNREEETDQLSGVHHKTIESVENILLIWLDRDIDQNNDDCCNTIKQLKHVVNNINTYTDDDQCAQFIETINDKKIFVIISDAFEEQNVSRLHHIYQVDNIFILNNNKQSDQQWTKKYLKIEGIFTEVSSICKALKQIVEQYQQNLIPISFIPNNLNDQSRSIFDLFDSSFIYFELIEQILSMIDFEERHFDEFIIYSRQIFNEDNKEIENINQLNREYYTQKPIWWYTWDSFLYRMINQALRSFNVGIIIRMGFFIYDLYRNLEQFNNQHYEKSFTVYRGQRISKKDFEQINKIKDHFISFNHFFLTNQNYKVSLHSAKQSQRNDDLIGILFIINIDVEQTSLSFASITDISYFHIEDQLLFPMHAVFRIDDIKLIDGNNHLYEVTLTLNNHIEKDIQKIRHRIREETFPDQKGWHRLGQLLIKTNQFTKAEELYQILLNQTTYQSEQTTIYHQLAFIKNLQKEYQSALIFYEKSLYLNQQILSSNHIQLAYSHTNIGAMHYNIGNYSKALSSYSKSLEIRQKSLPPDHLDLASSYYDIGMVYKNINDYPEALSFYEKALQIRQQSLPSTDPYLITLYNNIGMMHFNMANYPKALYHYEKAFQIQQESLPINHPDLSIYYNNIGMVYLQMGDNSKALHSYKKCLEIRQESLPSDHPDLATSHNNLAIVFFQMADYSKALSSYEKCLQIGEQTLPSNHSQLGDYYNNIGMVHYNMGNYAKALAYYEKSIEIKQKLLPPNHPSLATSYTNIGVVYINMGDYHKALQSHENALQIRQQSLPPNHPDLCMSFGHIGNIYNTMGQRSKALPFCQRAVDIAQQSLPSNHPHFQWYTTILQDLKNNL